MWSQSEARREFETARMSGLRNTWLLGDSGYGLEPWLMTPYARAQPNTEESYFNDIFAKARANVEMCIGIFKGRWRILMEERRARYSPEKLARFANVCAALHNICIKYKVPFNCNYIADEESVLHRDFEGIPQSRKLKSQARSIRDKLKTLVINAI